MANRNKKENEGQQRRDSDVEFEEHNEKIVAAGYVLLQAPNTTPKHRETQFLFSKLHDATPLF